MTSKTYNRKKKKKKKRKKKKKNAEDDWESPGGSDVVPKLVVIWRC